MSIEKSFLVFTFKLQHAFMRSAVFNVEWPTVPWYSDQVHLAEWKSKERVRKWGTETNWVETQDGRGRSVDWKTVISRCFSSIRASDLFQQAWCFWRCSQGEVRALESSHDFSASATLFLHSTVSLATLPHFYAPSTKSIWLCKVQHGPGECQLTVGNRRRA